MASYYNLSQSRRKQRELRKHNECSDKDKVIHTISRRFRA